ncbi:MAG: nucleotide disphospho-sugar-binding domain-containing protein [Anaerolineae bacterium]
MARLLFLSLPLAGHLDWGGMLATAAALAARGHAVAWASGAAVKPAIAAAGLDYVELAASGWQSLPSLPEDLPAAQRARLRQQRSLEAWLSPAAVLPALQEIERAMTARQPDALLIEPYAVAGALAAERTGRPLIVCGRPALPDGAIAANPAGQRAAELCRLAGVAGDYWDLATGQVRSPLLHIDFFSPRWYADLPAIAPQTSFVGSQPAPAAEGLDPPTILITLGSLFNQDPAFFRIAAEAVLLEGGQPVVVTGGIGDGPPGLPAGVEVQPWVDFGRILPRLAGIIHHGGVGTTHAALRAGLPQVAVPHAGDQQPQAGRITTAGVGYGVRPANFTLPAARWLVRQLLKSEALRQAAATWQAELAALGGVQAAATTIENNLQAC